METARAGLIVDASSLPGWVESDQKAWAAIERQLGLIASPEASVEAILQAIRAARPPIGLRASALISSDGTDTGLATGYFEPEVEGSLTPGGGYPVPLYAPPPGKPPDRQAIARGALAGHGLELVWLKDPIDAFFLEIQGSGCVRLPDGRVIGLSVASTSGHGYVPIGRVLIERGALEPSAVTMQSIRAWLEAHPQSMREVLDRNPRSAFFRLREAAWLTGTLGTPLLPFASVAVDPDVVPLGRVLWIEVGDAALPGGRFTGPAVAADTGGAIRGAPRIDLFCGSGAAAGEIAGRLKGRARVWGLHLA